MFLVDTDVLSQLHKRNPDKNVSDWMARQQTSDIFMSVITIGEIERGIALRKQRDPNFAEALTSWLHRLLALYAGNILPFDRDAARRWGRMSAAIGNRSPDLQIAATALEHGLTVATHNVTHFTPAGVAVFDPFTGKAHPPS